MISVKYRTSINFKVTILFIVMISSSLIAPFMKGFI